MMPIHAVFPGLGWILWRDAEHLPGEASGWQRGGAGVLGAAPTAVLLCATKGERTRRTDPCQFLIQFLVLRPHCPAEAMVFYENYLGTLERSITLNFSKPATNIIAQASRPAVRTPQPTPAPHHPLPPWP